LRWPLIDITPAGKCPPFCTFPVQFDEDALGTACPFGDAHDNSLMTARPCVYNTAMEERGEPKVIYQ
jgi:hypothetical protein